MTSADRLPERLVSISSAVGLQDWRGWWHSWERTLLWNHSLLLEASNQCHTPYQRQTTMYRQPCEQLQIHDILPQFVFLMTYGVSSNLYNNTANYKSPMLTQPGHSLWITGRHIIIHNPNHVLHRLLPPPITVSQWYNLRSRRHTLQLPEQHTGLLDPNFLVRMLYKDSY